MSEQVARSIARSAVRRDRKDEKRGKYPVQRRCRWWVATMQRLIRSGQY